MKRALFTLTLAFTLLPGVAQKITIGHLEPANWWIGMKNPDVQLLVHGPGIGAATVTLDYPGVVLKEVAKAESPNYLFLTLSVSPGAPAGRMPLVFRRGKARLTHAYELRTRSADTTRIRGFSAADLIYLVMPDRFANGDPQNDRVAGMKEGAARDNPLGRHGGDLKGIADRLDYVKDLGATALWLNPVQSNDQEKASYHGYAITDYYQIDPRFGTNETYKSLVDQSHARGLKVIMDLVHNHCGSGHWWMQDLPARDWIHQPDSAWPSYQSNFRASVISDPAGHVIFLDNHDLGRFYHEVGKDLDKFKMGVAFLLTTRGVPQLYYGTEILFDRSGSSHPDVRLDFPGGWRGDAVNAFTAAGRTAPQNAAFGYIRTLANWRKGKKVIHRGKLMQFVPEDNVYVYFRYDDRDAVMVVNGNAEAKTIPTARYAERLKGYNRAKDVATGVTLPQLNRITIPARTALVLELEK